jgi:hypothetical protein
MATILALAIYRQESPDTLLLLSCPFPLTCVKMIMPSMDLFLQDEKKIPEEPMANMIEIIMVALILFIKRFF